MTQQQAAALPTYDGNDLGAVWHRESTVFRLWAPTARSVRVRLYATGADDEPGAAVRGEYRCTRAEGGTWRAEVPGDLNGVYYTYLLGFSHKRAEIGDPYARAAGVNGQRSMVIDLDAAAPEGWAADHRPDIPPHARAVWEVHVADFTGDPRSGVPEEYRGKYLGFTVDGTTLDGKGDGSKPTCLNYLKRMGVSHVQLQPIFDFGRSDETDPDDYNWGYDPVNFNVPEGAYSTDPRRGAVRVRECRAMIAALHSAGLAVVMDVVYNHTYQAKSWLEQSVPGYYCRRTPTGKLTNGSGCGCDLASERTMYRKYMVDSVLYWAKEYHIDGFRFDLMALHDVDTMNAIRAALDELPGGRDILMYGEPWAGGSTCMDEGARPADKWALDALSPRIGFFCDNTRDAIKGSVFGRESPGFVNGAPGCALQILQAVAAWRGGGGGFTPKAAGQVVQYVSAHDNNTLWDKLKNTAHHNDYAVPEPELLARNRMAAGVYFTCQGMPFFQSGEEFARTKYGNDNSWRGPLSLNALDWARAARMQPLTDYYRGLLALRRAYPALSGAGGEAAPTLLALPGWLVGFVVETSGLRLAVYYNPEPTAQSVELPAGSWRMLCSGERAGAEPFGPVYGGALTLEPSSVTVLRTE
ncbi:MAG: type I pullulanase [Gemmiger sp.]